MKKLVFIPVGIIVLLFGIFEIPAFSKDEKVAPPKAEAAKKELTKEEMVADLKDELEGEDEIFEIIPNLKAEKDDKGNIIYKFNGIKLEEMAKDDLRGLLIKVHQNLVRMRTERIQRQLETVRRVERMQRMSAPQQPPRPPSQPQQPSPPPSPPAAPPAPSRK